MPHNKKAEKTVQVACRIYPDQKDRLNKLLEITGRSQTDFLREALFAYMDKKEALQGVH